MTATDTRNITDLKPFVVVFDDGTLTLWTESDLSYHWDMADCDGMDGIKAVYAVGNDGTLQQVKAGESEPINQHREQPFYFARFPVLTSDGKPVGWVTSTDH